MKARLDFHTVDERVMEGMLNLEKIIAGSGLEIALVELVKIRASQINQCAFCMHMHHRDARAAGETEERLYLLNAWRESPLYTDRELRHLFEDHGAKVAIAWDKLVERLRELPGDLRFDTVVSVDVTRGMPLGTRLALKLPIPAARSQVRRERIRLQGDVPSPLDPPPACPFHTRCWKAQDICRTITPPLRELAPGHRAACHFPENLPDTEEREEF